MVYRKIIKSLKFYLHLTHSSHYQNGNLLKKINQEQKPVFLLSDFKIELILNINQQMTF